MYYTISQAEIDKLAKARAAQVLRAQRDDIGGLATVPHVAPVEWRNGRVDVRPLRIDLLARWAKLVPADSPIGVEMNESGILFLAGSSRMNLLNVPLQIGGRNLPPSECVKYYGPALLLESLPPVTGNESKFVCRAEIGDLKSLRADKSSRARGEKLAKLESSLVKARHVFATLVELLASDRAIVAGADLPAAVATAKVIRDAKRKARRFSKQLTAFFRGSSNFPTFDAWDCPADSAAAIAEKTHDLESLLAKDSAMQGGNWKSMHRIQTRITNLRRKIVQLVTPAVADTLNIAGICNAGASVPGESRRNINNEPRIYIHREWEGNFHNLTNARRHVRELPGQIYWKEAEIEKLELDIAKLNKQLAESGVTA